MVILIQKPLTFSSCKRIAHRRLKEAKILYYNKLYSGAYYLAGYAIEIGMKACFCKQIKKYTMPDKDALNNVYVHDLNKLRDTCGLKAEFEKDSIINVLLTQKWGTVKDWSEKSRYIEINQSDSKDMIDSVVIIFDWIQTKW